MSAAPRQPESTCGTNLRRLMAKLGLTLDDVVARCGVDERTIRAILAGQHKPQAKTLHRLATGLEVATDEFFQDPSLLAYHAFDRATNPVVDEVVAAHPQRFAGWSQRDFDELYSRFGAGGALTFEGTVTAVDEMNRKREILRKAALVLETSEAELLANLVNVLYDRVVIRPPS